MASDINHVILLGRLTRDIELRYTNGGSCVGRFSLAVNRNKRSADGQWEEETGFFDVVLWGKQAESLSTYLRKGKQIAVEGSLRQDRWEQDGQKRSRVEIAANTVQLLGAEKAMFRHLKSGKKGPKHGVIYQHPDVHRAPYWQRGKIARALAGKVLIAAKIDQYHGEFAGDRLNEEFSRRVEDIRRRYPDPPKKPQKSGKKGRQGKGGKNRRH